MHQPEVRAQALRLVEAGVNDCEVARRLGVPRTTVRDWRAPRYESRVDYDYVTCPRCWTVAKPMRFEAETYAALLGLYLGDGSIVRMKRTYRLRVHLDAKYDGIVGETWCTLRTVMPHHSIGLVERHEGRMIDVSVYDSHLPCLFPQHGPGKKHERPIVLEPWQRKLVDDAPFDFIRGCLWSDGCCYLNRTGKYVYRSYAFDNLSQDILDLFAVVCGQAGVRCNRNRRSVRIYRREAVALIDREVGGKV